MSIDTLIFWLFIVAWAIVVGIFAFVLMPRIIGEVRRIIAHVVQLAEGSALPLQLSKAEADVARIELALARIPVLRARGLASLTTIRETPLVPPGIAALVGRVQVEVSAFRAMR